MRNTARIFVLLLTLLFCLAACASAPEQSSDSVPLELLTEEQSGQSAPAEEEEETEEPDALDAQTPELPESVAEQADSDPDAQELPESGEYTSKDDVARYLYLYGHLPGNYITKNQAKKLGWVSSQGNLGEVAPGKSIGGDRFGNYEGILPEGHTYHECDIDTDGSYRGAKRIVWSEDGQIYYTEDHYEHFELLYGEE